MNPTKATPAQITERLIAMAGKLSDGFSELEQLLIDGEDAASVLYGMSGMSDDMAAVETGLAVLAYIQADDYVESNDTEA